MFVAAGEMWAISLIYKRTRSVCVVGVGFLIFLGVCLLYLPEPLSLDQLVSVPRNDDTVIILIWTHPFDRYRKLPDCSARFQISGCMITDDVRAYLYAEAVIIHHREIAIGTVDLPPDPRPRAQKWIWMNYESPAHTPNLWHFDDDFNLTMSYRTDSDIFLPYGYLIPRSRTGTAVRYRYAQPLDNLSRTRLLRPRLLAWVISNWSESQERVAFYHQLRQYLRVDVFGRAGQPLPEDTGGASVVRLIRRYQFYLALENSQHTDYITEKLWNAVVAGAIPVVLGPSRKNYERFLPPEAFIHVDDFPTVRGLARYLVMLRRNPMQLRKHLDWRERYSVHQPTFWAEHYCSACRAVRRNRGKTNVVQDIASWFYT